jgi:hypothetical protein
MKHRGERGLGRISEDSVIPLLLEFVLFIAKIDTPMPLKALKNNNRTRKLIEVIKAELKIIETKIQGLVEMIDFSGADRQVT